MKRSIAGIAVLAGLLGTPALAAEMPLKAPPCCALEWSWTGFYIGANAGGGWATDTVTRLDHGSAEYPVGYSANQKFSGILGGGQIGYDFQFNKIVLGVYGNIDAADLTATTPELSVLGDELSTHSTKINWIADAGGRVGLAWGSWLPYVKGGGAWINETGTSIDTAVPAGTFIASATVGSKTFSGWVIGDGWEYKLSPNLSGFAEYDYYGFTGTTTQVETVGPAVGAFHDSGHSGNISVVKVGLNYRFNSAPAPVPCCVTK